MIELTQHIEALLLENDFVIIPDFGGFVAHYNQARKADSDNLFCPPTRTIGFNPKLTLNDGILIQSYMAVHDIDFPGATKMVSDEVRQLVDMLHENGKVELPNIGELHYTIHHTYDFIPFNEKVITPSLYGLNTFEMKPLSELHKRSKQPVVEKAENFNGHSYDIHINKTLLRNAVAVVVAIATFFMLSTPIENTRVEKGSYAQLLPIDIFETIEGQSVLTSQVKTDGGKKQTVDKSATDKQNIKPANKNINNEQGEKLIRKDNDKQSPNNNKSDKQDIKSNDNKDIKQDVKPVQGGDKASMKADNKVVGNKYHIIVSSRIEKSKALELIEKLKAKGYATASLLENGSKVSVSLMSFSSKDEAAKALSSTRKQNEFSDAWIYTR